LKRVLVECDLQNTKDGVWEKRVKQARKDSARKSSNLYRKSGKCVMKIETKLPPNAERNIF
jgi:hypothetical protein